jgi:UDP-N-acetyl-D-mannosaminuronate dehydrogenase
VTAKKKVQLTHSQGKKKKRDEVNYEDDDDVVRTSVSQDKVRATQCTEELFPLHSVYIVLPTYQTGKNIRRGEGYWRSTQHTRRTS